MNIAPCTIEGPPLAFAPRVPSGRPGQSPGAARRRRSLLLGLRPSACLTPAPQAASGQSPGSSAASKPSGWNDKPVNGSRA